MFFAFDRVDEQLDQDETDNRSDWDEYEIRHDPFKYEFNIERPSVKTAMNVEEENKNKSHDARYAEKNKVRDDLTPGDLSLFA